MQLELVRTPFYLVVREDSPLAQHEAITIDLLHELSWALFERHIQPALYDALLGAASRASVRPSTVHHIATAEEGAQELYGESCDVAFLTRAGAWRIARNGLAMRPLEQPNLELSTKLIAKASNSSRVVSEFFRALKRKLEVPRKEQLPLPLNKL